MKVLSAHVVTKLQDVDSMDLLIMPDSAVDVKMELPVLHRTYEGKLINSSHTENINRKRWRRLFRRVQRKDMQHRKPLFGQPLSDICEYNASLPKPVMEILSVLWRDGPNTEGVFRKAGNAKALKEIKEHLNSGVEVDLKNKPVILLADLFKDFLRNLPGSLLVVDQYQAWMTAMQMQDVHERCTKLQLVINKLPETNIHLLKYLIVMLYHISVSTDKNKMDSNSLAVCVSPNLLQANNVEMFKNVSHLTEFLIDNCCKIFGEDVLSLFEDSDEEDLSDNQDSVSSIHLDSVYDSNDPDSDGYKGSYTDMHAFPSDAEEKTLEGDSSSSESAERQTKKHFIRRCSEPTIVFKKGAQSQSVLTRSQTETDFYGQHLTKQISDECVLLGTGSRLLPAQNNIYTSCPGEHLQHTTKDFSCCSSSSLESGFSSASESSIKTSSPIISSPTQRLSLQRKQSFPNRPTARNNEGGETTKKRSQSMKPLNSRTKVTFSRGGTSKQAQKALRQSQTLPEVLPHYRSFVPPQKPRRLSSEEVFQQVDSRNQSVPPSYEQAIQDNVHPALSLHVPLTVEAARCLYTCSQTTFQTDEPSDSCLVKNCSDGHSYRVGEKSHVLTVTATSLKSGPGTLSETLCEECNPSLAHCSSEELLETLNVRESYV